MSIVLAGIAPHSPVLIPAIGKENLKRLKATEKAYKRLEEELYAAQPDILVIISPHGMIQQHNISLNLSPHFYSAFEDFGDFTTKMEHKGNIGFAHQIRERLETTAPLQLISMPNLDHGVSIPLFMLTKNLPNITILPIYYSGLDLDAHFKIGQMLKSDLLFHNHRVAVLASGDLSHRLTRTAPAGFSTKGKKFDKKVIDFLLSSESQGILQIDKDLIVHASECGLKSIVMLLGILDGIKNEPQLLSYEYPFGVGYLTMQFRL